MPNKMIPFPYEIKITHSDLRYNGIFYSIKNRRSGSLFIFYFIVSIVMALGRMV